MDPHSDFKVNLYQATLSIEEVKVPLTLDVAKQLPIVWYENVGEILWKDQPLPEPICKVLKEVIADPISDEALLEEQEITWLYLINRPGWGLGWVVPLTKDGESIGQQGILREGGWINDPEQVKTALLF